AEMRASADVVEIETLARAKSGELAEAVAALETLIARAGPTSEREGLLGGRYKTLYETATHRLEQGQYPAKAIQHYERGLMLDLTDFYPATTLPRLYRARGRKGDDDRAQGVAQVVYYACRRAQERDQHHPWVRQTLLGAAFDAGDLAAAESLYDDIIAEG